MIGDFNAVLNKELDRSRITPAPEIPVSLQAFFKKWDFVDIWWEKNLNKREYTFFSHRHQSYSRIDYIVTSRILIVDILCMDIGNVLYSDHALFSMSWRWRTDSGTKIRYWRTNNFLEDPVIAKTIETKINFFLILIEILRIQLYPGTVSRHTYVGFLSHKGPIKLQIYRENKIIFKNN